MAVALTATPYQRALAAIDAVSWRGIKPGLERTEALLQALGEPQQGLRGVLVAGTNGKGSVCAVVDSVLREAGLRSVLLTKPHLVSYCERFVFAGAQISEDGFATLVEEVAATAARLDPELQPTGFELLTAAGILFAARQAADAVVCEVGLGGRLDSTNVLDLGVAAVTNVALDHREHLGDTVAAIAREKAAIIKPGDAAVTGADGEALDIVRTRCADVDAHLVIADIAKAEADAHAGFGGVRVSTEFAGAPLALSSPLLGRFQAGNVLTAVAVCDAMRARGMRIDPDAVVRGCASARWPGRMQWIAGDPPLLLDAAHNPAGMTAMIESLEPLIAGRSPLVAVVATMRDKDVAGMAAALQRAPDLRVVATTPEVQRALAAEELARYFTPPALPVPAVSDALAAARDIAGEAGLVLVCGSLYLIGEVLQLLGV